MFVVLDPKIIWFSPYTNEQFIELKDKIFFIDKYLNIKYFVSEELLKQFIQLNKYPMSSYRESEVVKNEIVRKIMRRIDYENICSLEKESLFKGLQNSFQKTNITEVDDTFSKVLSIFNKKCISGFLFLSKLNYSEIILINSVTVVGDLFVDENSPINEILSNPELVNKESIKEPKSNNPLPNSELCELFETKRRPEVLKIPQRLQVAIWRKIGKQVANRNGYSFDSETSKKNSNNGQIRDVYINSEKTFYLSIDIEHGGIEVFDTGKTWLGEYSYTGELLTKQSDLNDKEIRKKHILK